MIGYVADGSNSEWKVQLQQELTVLLCVFDDETGSPEFIKAEVMGWDNATILDIRRRHVAPLGTAVETEIALPITVKNR